MIEQSETIDVFTVALVKVQQAVETVRKDAKNSAYKQNGKESTYASLKSTWQACRAELTENGFAVTQWPGAYCRETNQMQMTTCLMHSSGQWQRGTAEIPMGKADAQGYGSAVTYARRYALQAAVGLSPDDDDGNAASLGRADPHANQEPNRQSGQKLAGPITSITGLEKAIKAFAVEMGKIASFEEWYALKNAHADLLIQAERDHPDWWSGWNGQPDGFTPLRRRIEILEATLEQKEAA